MKLDEKHCFNFIKKCPYCKLVWIIDKQCNGKTTCGSLPDQDEVFNNVGSFRKYRFKFTENNVTYQ